MLPQHDLTVDILHHLCFEPPPLISQNTHLMIPHWMPGSQNLMMWIILFVLVTELICTDNNCDTESKAKVTCS